jgi:hypothetical protein
LGCWISPHYSPFSLGGCFETYGEVISLILKLFFSGCSKQRITETMDTESMDTGGTTVFSLCTVRLFPPTSAVSLFCFSLQASLDTKIMMEVAIISKQPLSRS